MNILNKEELRRQIREGKEISLDGIFSQRVQAPQWNYGKIHKVRKRTRGGLHSLIYSPNTLAGCGLQSLIYSR